MFVPGALCDSIKPAKRNDFLDDLLKNSRQSSENFDPIFGRLQDVLPQDMIEKVGVYVHNAVDTGVPMQLSYGFMMGYSSGFCVKKVSRAFAFVIGGFFVGMQALAWKGYAKVETDKLKRDVEGIIDLNNDGRVDAEDVKIAYEKLHSVLGYNMPVGGGFTAGLLIGLRS
jgi:uncharacterized membrane protein (Fun14 family)